MNVTKMYDYTEEILSDACIHFTGKNIRKFVDESLSRHAHFIDKIPFDEDGRLEIPFETTPEIILQDNFWLERLLDETKIQYDKLAIVQGKLWFVDKSNNKAMPLTKALHKINEKNNIYFRKSWYSHFDQFSEIGDNVEKFLCFLGDITNVEKLGIISINPADYLRQAFSPKYCSFSTCHNLKTGGYKYGPINYAMDKYHLMNYLVAPKDENKKILGRVMMVIDEDFKSVSHRRFYLSQECFGRTRADRIRKTMHGYLNGEDNESVFKEVSTHGGKGYIDGLTKTTFVGEPCRIRFDMSSDIFCFRCGCIFQDNAIYCPKCANILGRSK